MAEGNSIQLGHSPLIDSVEENTEIVELSNSKYCHICNKYFKHSYAAMQHKIDKHKWTGISTPVSDVENKDLKSSLLKSIGEVNMLYSCDVCNRNFKKETALQQHRKYSKKHLKLYSKLYTQPPVENTSLEAQSSKLYPQSPVKSAALEEQKPELCPICNKSFQNQKSLQEHLGNSKKHRKLLRKMNARLSKINVEISKLETQISKDGEDPLFVDSNIETCEVCNKRFLCKQFYQAHRLSFAHKIKIMETTIVHQMKGTTKVDIDNVKQICKEINRESLLKLIEEESEEFDSILDEFGKVLHENLKESETQTILSGLKSRIICPLCQCSWQSSNKGLLNFVKHYFRHCKKENEKHTYELLYSQALVTEKN